MDESTTITVGNQLSELERVAHLLNVFGQHHGLSPKVAFEVGLALDEVLTNVISYAYDDDATHQIVVRLMAHAGELEVQVEDDGREFNPLAIPKPAIDAPLEGRPIGGLGMHLVRTLMDRLEYRRHGGTNVLTMKKTLTASSARRAAEEPHMEIRETKSNGIVVLALQGRLDASNADALEGKLLALIHGGTTRLVIDAAALDYINSAGLQVLLVAAKRLRGRGQIVLAALSDPIRGIFDIAGFSTIFTVYHTQEDAIAALQ